MAKRLQLRRGTTTEHDTFTGAVGELTYDTEKKQLRVHDGSTVGGKVVDDPTRDVTSQVSASTETVEGKAKIATTAMAQAGTNDTDFITALKLKNVSFGMGQTNQNVTSSRAASTTYTNSSGKTRFVMVTSNGGNNISVVGYVDEAVVVSSGTSSSYGTITSITFPVPPDSTYKVAGSFSRWVEY